MLEGLIICYSIVCRISLSNMYTLQPLLKAGVFQPGPKLTCSVSGRSYDARLGINGEIHCLCGCSCVFRSPSAFSVHIKRKVNPGRKADDGWTSTRYMGIPLGAYRAELEQLLADDQAANGNPNAASPDNAILLTQVVKQKRKSRAARIATNAHHQEATDTAEDSDITHEAPAPAAAQSKQCGLNNNQAALGHQHQQQHHKGAHAQQPTGMPLLAHNGLGSLRQPAPLSHQPGTDLRYTWVRCSNLHCRKWRQVQYTGQPPAHDWTCSSSDLSKLSSCRVPQQLPDVQVKLILQDEAGKRFAASSSRPALHLCSQETFEADLMAFLVCRGDEQLAALVRDKRITCNNSPLDLFGLYRQVVHRGGLITNETYDDRGRWSGGINFAGDVFPRLMNFTVNNRATSVGNQLLNNYKKFLLSYEHAYHSRDVQAVAVDPAAAAAAGGGVSGEGSDSPLESDDAEMQVSGPLSVLADAALAPVEQQQQQQQQQHGRLLIRHSDQQQGAPVDVVRPAKKQRTSAGPTTGSTSKAAQGAAAADSSPPADQLKQQQQCQHCQQQDTLINSIPGSAESIARLLAAVTTATYALAGQHSWCLPGSVILLHHNQQQQQGATAAAVVAHIQQLPVGLAAAAAGAGCRHQHQVHADQSTTPAENTGLPVLLLGSRQLCWVDRSICQPLSLPQAHAALQDAQRKAHASTHCSSRVSSSNSPGIHQLPVDGSSCKADCRTETGCCQPRGSGYDGETQHHYGMQQLAHFRGLKQAVQWAVSCSNSTSSGSQSTTTAAADQLLQQPSKWVTSAGCTAVADELLLLEAQLPIAGVSSSSSAYWECWRDAVHTASTPDQLAHQVLMLAYQCETALLLPNMADAMWTELHKLLGIAQGLTRKAWPEDTLKPADTVEGGLLLPHALPTAPNVLSVSEAVRVLGASLDQGRVQQMWQSDVLSGSHNATVLTPDSAAAVSKVQVPLKNPPMPAADTQQQATQSIYQTDVNALMSNHNGCLQKQHILLSAVQAALAAEGCTVQQLHDRLLGSGAGAPSHPCQNMTMVGFSTLSRALEQAPMEVAAAAASIASDGVNTTNPTCVSVGLEHPERLLECCSSLVLSSAATVVGTGAAGPIKCPAVPDPLAADVDVVGRQSSDSFLSCDDAVLCR